MRQALPLWCCLTSESKLAVLEALARLGRKTFDEPQPIWKEFISIETERAIDDYEKYKRMAKFMSQKSCHPAQVKL